MSDKLIAAIVIPAGIAIGSLSCYLFEKGMDYFELLIDSLKNYFTLKFEEREKLIISRYLESKYRNLKNDLRYLSHNLIENKNCLIKIKEKTKKLLSNNKEMEKFLLEKKKIFILGETGVGKSTLINCIEGNKKLAPEAKVGAPTTMEFKEYVSNKYKNYIFCDTRGMEIKNAYEIEKSNTNKIIEHSKGLNSYLFWYLKGASSNFQDSDAEYIKKIEKALKGKMPLFFVITKSIDEDEEKRRLEIAVKEHFPYNKTIQIFPVLARGNKRNPSFGLDELMEGTENFFKKDILLNEVFKYIYEDNNKYNKLFLTFLEKSYMENLFGLILSHVRLDNYDNPLDSEEKTSIKNFISINYKHFVDSNINEIAQLCCLIKAKYEIIDINNTEQTTKRLSSINNSLKDNVNMHPKDEILQGISEKERKIIELKAKKYYDNENISQVKLLLNWYVAELFRFELINQVKENLLTVKGLIN